MFQVDAAGGELFALRISRPGARDRLAIESELIWIEALGRETDIVVPRPVRARWIARGGGRGFVDRSTS